MGIHFDVWGKKGCMEDWVNCVIYGCLEGPLSHKDQGDCRGGNKTGGLVHSSAAYIYMNETIEKIQTQWMCLGHYVEQNTNRE